MIRFSVISLLISVAVVSAYASDSQSALLIDKITLPTVGTEKEATDHKITLDTAIEKALTHSLSLKASGAAKLASKGERRQAGIIANPELAIETENVLGSTPYKGFDAAEITVGVSQPVEIGGKRSSRIDYADQGLAIARMDEVGVKFDVIRDVTIAYAEVIATKEKVKLAEEAKALASEMLTSVKHRVTAAREPVIQQSKAQVAVETTTIALEKAKRELSIAKAKLAALWNSNDTHYDLDSSAFFTLLPLPSLEKLKETLLQNPNYVKWHHVVARSKAALAMEKANAIPDPRINVGVRHFREEDAQAFVAGVSLPIPVFNRNQGTIAKARHELRKTESEAEQSKLLLLTELNRIYEEVSLAHYQASRFKSAILPSAEKAFSLARQYYLAGKFPYFEVLDAQRTLFDVREQYHLALKDYHSKQAELTRLTTPITFTEQKKNDAK